MSTKPRIHVIELDYHPDMLSSFLSLVDDDCFEIILSSKREIIQKIPIELLLKIKSVCVLGENGVTLNSIASTESDLHVFNTLASNYSFWAKNMPKNHIIRIHNIHTWFAPNAHINYGKTWLEWRKSLTHILYRRLILNDGKYIHHLANSSRLFSFMSENNARYFEQLRPDLKEKVGPVFTNAWSENISLKRENNKGLKILIPGTPEYKRKDFVAIQSLIQWAKNREEHIQIVFAGKAPSYMYSALDELNKLAESKLEILYFKNFVDPETFDKMLAEADVLFFPIKEFTRFKIFEEKYGYSKISGSENDFIRFGKASFFPSFYPINSDLIISYSHQNLIEKLDVFANQYSENIEDWKLRMKEHRERYAFAISKEEHNVYLRKLVALYGKN